MSKMTHMDAFILAIDLGTTSFKAAVYDAALQVKGHGQARLTHRFEAGGVVELDVEHAEDAFRTAVRDAIHSAEIAPKQLNAVGITSQAQTFTVCGPDGRARTPFLSWQDCRPAAGGQVPAGPPAFAEHSSVGEYVPLLLAAKLQFMQARAGGHWVGPDDQVLHLPTYLIRCLSGRAVIDANLAAMSGLYSLVQGGWWDESLHLCGIDKRQLPDLVSLGDIAAVTVPVAEAWGLVSGVPIVSAGNDQTAGACGAELHRDRGLLITLGTAQVAYACLDRLPKPVAGTIRGPYLDGLYYQMADDCAGGGTVNWAQGILAGCGSDEAFAATAARAPAGCDGLIFEADLNSSRGGWTRAGLHHSPAHFARAVYECLARRMNAMLRQRLGIDPTTVPLHVAGGGVRSRVWMEELARELGAAPRKTDASPLLGAARMGLRAIRI